LPQQLEVVGEPGEADRVIELKEPAEQRNYGEGSRFEEHQGFVKLAQPLPGEIRRLEHVMEEGVAEHREWLTLEVHVEMVCVYQPHGEKQVIQR